MSYDHSIYCNFFLSFKIKMLQLWFIQMNQRIMVAHILFQFKSYGQIFTAIWAIISNDFRLKL
jgi:hypothetical protein